MPDTPIMSEQESLALITSMIQKARNSYIETGVGPLCWGVLISFCSLFTWAEKHFDFQLGADIWLLSLIALIPQVYFSVRARKTQQHVAHDEIVMNYVWSAFAVCIFLLSFYASQVQAPHVTALHMMIFGIPTFITGGFRRFPPMIIGGLICWICCVVSVYTDFETDMLLMAASALFAWLIPGIILRKRYLKLKHV
ncbi:MAG TPA: hypothetical protein VG842_10525 [Sediminibacterium sp.]|nr:hypothetical protein [Sediminibacterium sp.]